ncbi:uncharacterized conserved protein [Hahella chejuensis KCTC 2396]|uniref:GTP cyclohydrolase 1 type 2 homolog n=1 Tax=Hahella chejuensis (strain KCTC 2396) TaxID=349521 RepID=Q2SBJ9_HAHCH|nr:Nif3-like dinuclear metal center hexameric protein [Hahella chejuensis]ABC31975.1 uncharacterized conserved protein [Hahella chejuensis KCTC 2396]
MTDISTIMTLLNSWLQPDRIRDYCPNGLQVEGRKNVRKILCGVTASEQLLDAAIEQGADAVLVHHGYFWKGESAAIVGMKRRRIAKLLQHEISLIAYHLPLDIHPDYGNNAALAAHLGFTVEGRVKAGDVEGLLWRGALPQPMLVSDLAEHIGNRLQRAPMVICDDPGQVVSTVAWCTGGAQGFIDQAVSLGVDVYLSGEISEQTVHSAREQGIVYVAAGHHATERYGVQALGKALAENVDVEISYFDGDNPV